MTNTGITPLDKTHEQWIDKVLFSIQAASTIFHKAAMIPCPGCYWKHTGKSIADWNRMPMQFCG